MKESMILIEWFLNPFKIHLKTAVKYIIIKVSANSGEFNEFYEKCNLKDQRLFVNQTIDLDHKCIFKIII